MSAIWTIAKRDMRGFFSAPKGVVFFWFVLLLFGVFFGRFMLYFLEMQQEAPMMGGQGPTLELLIERLFANFHFILLLAIPAFTMASFAEEKRSQSIRLLQTAPVSSFQIVLGKFLAAVGSMLILIVASMAYPAFLMLYGNPDPGVIWTSYLGIFLLASSQLAFGLWFSSMTSNQFVAFTLTLLGLFILLILDVIVAPNMISGGWLQDSIKYLSTTGHLEPFLSGRVTVRSTAYFLCFTATFLFFTNLVVDSQRWR